MDYASAFDDFASIFDVDAFRQRCFVAQLPTLQVEKAVIDILGTFVSHDSRLVATFENRLQLHVAVDDVGRNRKRFSVDFVGRVNLS